MCECPMKFPGHPELQLAFEHMRESEMILDDMDYATDSPRLRKAMAAAKEFNRLLEIYER